MSKLKVKDIKFDNDRCYVNVNGIFSVHIIKTDEGIVLDVYPATGELDEPIVTTYAFDNEAMDDDIDNEPNDCAGLPRFLTFPHGLNED